MPAEADRGRRLQDGPDRGSDDGAAGGFPDGVCDYTKPGVGQTQKITTWAIFKDDGTFVGL